MDSRHDRQWQELYRPRFPDPDLANLNGKADQPESVRQSMERIQHADRQIKAALNDVPVPPELKDRVLRMLSEVEQPPRRRLLTVPRLLITGALACSLVLAIMLAQPWTPRTWDVNDVSQQAVEVYLNLEDHPVVYPGKVARDFPFAFGFSGRDYVGVHQPKFLGVTVNAYEFRQANGSRRALVIALPHERFEEGHLQVPQTYSTSAGLAVQFFEAKDYVYVAVYRREHDLTLFTAGQSLTRLDVKPPR